MNLAAGPKKEEGVGLIPADSIFLFSSLLKECLRSELATILLLGCLRLLLQLKKIVWAWTLQKFIEDQIYFSRNTYFGIWAVGFASTIKFYLVLKIFSKTSLSNFIILLCFRHNREVVENLSKPSSNSKELNFPSKYSQSFFEQFLTCLWKQNLSYWRNPQYTAVKFFYTVVISLMLGTICWKFGSKRCSTWFPFKYYLELI